jgi:hypothetical protein
MSSEIFVDELKRAILDNDGDTVIALCTSEQMAEADLDEVLQNLYYLQGRDHYLYDVVAHFKYLLHLFNNWETQHHQ